MDIKSAISNLQNANLAGPLREAADMAVGVLQGAGQTGEMGMVTVVIVPIGEDLEAVQRRIVREMSQRVLVLPEGYRWSVEYLPLAVEMAEAAAEPPPPKPDEAREKQEILARLKAYRAAKGLGCLGNLAKVIRRKDVTETTLRNVLSGDVTLTMVQWRAIQRGLEKIEKEVPE